MVCADTQTSPQFIRRIQTTGTVPLYLKCKINQDFVKKEPHAQDNTTRYYLTNGAENSSFCFLNIPPYIQEDQNRWTACVTGSRKSGAWHPVPFAEGGITSPDRDGTGFLHRCKAFACRYHPQSLFCGWTSLRFQSTVRRHHVRMRNR